MDVFLSWSTERSKKLANIFNEWICNVLPTIETYISTEQIGPGERWSANIGKGLETNFMGIFFMVEENIDSPWLNFEAGAISKNIEDSKVIPLLHNLKPEQINGPIAQFQAKLIDEKIDILAIVKQINNGITDERKINNEKLIKLFDKWYPDFIEEYEKFCVDNPEPVQTKEKESLNLLDSQDQIGEILNIVRNINRSESRRTYQKEINSKKDITSLDDLEHVRKSIQEIISGYNLDEIMKYKDIDRFKQVIWEKVYAKYRGIVPARFISNIISEEVQTYMSRSINLEISEK